MKQQVTEEHYAYYSNLQYKNEEISKLKNELKLAQRQIQVLRKTMEHMLKVDEQDLDDGETKRKRYIWLLPCCIYIYNNSFYDTATTMNVDLLLHNHPDHRSSTSDSSLSSTKPPSPTAYFEEDSEDEPRESFLNEDRYLVKKRVRHTYRKARFNIDTLNSLVIFQNGYWDHKDARMSWKRC